MYLIQCLGFTLDDLILFLDTHPCDQEALKYYKKYKALHKEAVDEYTKHFGPLTAKNVNVENEWTWTQMPWPWEKENC